MPELSFSLVSLIAAHENNIYFKPEKVKISKSLRVFSTADSSSLLMGHPIRSWATEQTAMNGIVSPSVETSPPVMEVETVVRGPSVGVPMDIPVIATGNSVPPLAMDVDDSCIL